MDSSSTDDRLQNIRILLKQIKIDDDEDSNQLDYLLLEAISGCSDDVRHRLHDEADLIGQSFSEGVMPKEMDSLESAELNRENVVDDLDDTDLSDGKWLFVELLQPRVARPAASSDTAKQTRNIADSKSKQLASTPACRPTGR